MHTIDFIILYLNWMSEIILKLKKNKMPIALAFSLKKILIAKKKKKAHKEVLKDNALFSCFLDALNVSFSFCSKQYR